MNNGETQPDRDAEHAHNIMLARADADYLKRLRDKQKRFGKPHDIDEDIRKRGEVVKANRDELVRLMLQFGFTIAARDFPNWRPTLRSKGTIPGVWDVVELIATDGLLGMFLNEQQEPTLGHIQMFDGEVKPLFSIQTDKTSKEKVRKPRTKSKRQQLLDSL